ncbi:MAG: peptide chain release factor N(5)-glutamine methyltransferase [Bacteroidaceae bacterium]|nr:peptide chain release factor N(5)-glutamine methyltransferase [Bacteroidaceae bacterium]
MDPKFTSLRQQLATCYPEREAHAVALRVLEDAFGVSRTDVYADKVRKFSSEEELRWQHIAERLSTGEPLQYVLGEAEFCGRSFGVAPGVLIPRSETEELVALVEQSVSGRCRILDAGTGSGCIAVSLALALPETEVQAWDISPEALSVAQGNAERWGAAVDFRLCDMLTATPDEHFDVVVSNPPYVCERERLDMTPQVLEHEPGLALFVPDDDPLRFYRALVGLSVRCLNSGGLLAVEINEAYGAETADLFSRSGLTEVQMLFDGFGKPRFVLGRKG